MSFKPLGLLAVAVTLIHSPVSVADPYWDYMAQAMTGHPAYQIFVSTKESATSLMSIEEARRYPKVEGVLSRMDGASTLTPTPSAWQTGLALSYPLFDNQRQDARDEIAKSQGQQELTSSAQYMERLMVDLANAHIRMWEATESIKVLQGTSRHLAALQTRVAEQVKAGEASQLLQSKFLKMGLEIKTKLLDAQQRLDSSSKVWAITGIQPGQSALLPSWSSVTDIRSPNANLRRLEAELARAGGEHSLAKRDEGLAVNVQASTLARKFQSQSNWQEYQIWQVSATYPLFDGGLARSRTQREALNMATKQAELEAERSQTEIELGRLQAWLGSMQEIIASFEDQCRLQKQIAENMMTRFELGRGSLTEVTEGYLAANDCSLTVIRNRADYYARYHDLSKLNGTLAHLIMDGRQ